MKGYKEEKFDTPTRKKSLIYFGEINKLTSNDSNKQPSPLHSKILSFAFCYLT